MELECKLLSYSTESLTKTTNGVWWWEGAPVFTKDQTICIWNNGQKLEFKKADASFKLTLESIHDIKMGILEILILTEGMLQNKIIGYTFKKVEDLLKKKNNSIHYLKLLPMNDPISGWLYTGHTDHETFKPKEMDFYLAMLVKTTKNLEKKEKKKILFFQWAGFLKNEVVVGRIFDLQQAFLFLFRNMYNVSDFVYGLRELFQYYNFRASLEFKDIPLNPFIEKKSTFLESIYQMLFGEKENQQEKRIRYSQYLKKVLQTNNPFKWHVEPESFYKEHLENYRYAIAPYGQVFLNLHSLMNVIKNKIVQCECVYCKNPKINQEEKYFHLFTGIPYEDILHEDSKYLEHVMFIEKKEKYLYIAFKGTLHSREALIDIDYKYHKYKENLFHRGIFMESLRFFKEKEVAILYHVNTNKLKGIKLVGQSLGGALSMLVWMFLRESKLFMNYEILCIAYSPPPIINNPSWFAKLTGKKSKKSSITVLIYGNDIVPTLCTGNVYELRLLATHFYAINISNYKNKNKYIHSILRKLKKKGMPKLYIPGDIYKIQHTTTSPSTFLVRRSHWTEYSAIKLWTKAFIHHTPGAMINSLQKSLKYFYVSNKEYANVLSSDKKSNFNRSEKSNNGTD